MVSAKLVVAGLGADVFLIQVCYPPWRAGKVFLGLVDND